MGSIVALCQEELERPCISCFFFPVTTSMHICHGRYVVCDANFRTAMMRWRSQPPGLEEAVVEAAEGEAEVALAPTLGTGDFHAQYCVKCVQMCCEPTHGLTAGIATSSAWSKWPIMPSGPLPILFLKPLQCLFWHCCSVIYTVACWVIPKLHPESRTLWLCHIFYAFTHFFTCE